MVGSYVTLARATEQQKRDLNDFATAASLATSMDQVHALMDLQGLGHKKGVMHQKVAKTNPHLHHVYTARDAGVYDLATMKARRDAKKQRQLTQQQRK